MPERRTTIKRKVIHAGGWLVVKRFARMLPFGGAFIAVALVGDDIKKKGLVRGVLNAGIDAVPIVGLAKNAVEIVTGDIIPDKEKAAARKRI